jgi:hypothetical protein
MLVERELPPEGWTPPEPSRWERIPAAGKAAVVVVALALVAALLYAVFNGDGDATKKPTPPASAAPAGIEFSDVTVGKGGTRELVPGVPAGYPHTKEGGAAAALNWAAAFASPAMFRKDTATKILDYQSGAPSWAAWKKDTVDPTFKLRRINASGVPVDATGAPRAHREFVFAALLRYGTFRVESASTDRITVDIWSPYVFGVADRSASDLRVQPEVKVVSGGVTQTLAWSRGDWRLVLPKKNGGPNVPLEESTYPVTSFKYRAAHFPASEGWQVVADAVETAAAIPWIEAK